jgi:putative methionine-R-sulfoxide reductase with GAF domain
MPSGEGLAGLAVEEERSFIENRPYDNPRFNDSIDRQSGFHTKNIIVSPIFDSHGKVMGVIQLLNKSGGFDEKDLEFLPFFAHFVSGFIELAILRDRGL